jgi:glycosyltransferase involved in cell wall biosynthesis
LKVAIDARALSTPYEQRGIGYHVKNMVQGLPETAPDLDFVFFLGHPDAARYLPSRKNVSQKILCRTWRRAWLEDLLKLPREIRESGAHLFHGPVALGPLRDLNLPLRSPVPVVSTIYDMHVETLDDPHMKAYRSEWRYRLQRWAVKRTTVVTCSDYTRRILLKRGLVQKDRVHLIPINLRETPPPRRAEKEDLVLFIGDTVHKNITAALSVFQALVSRAPGWRFVVVGSRERILALAEDRVKALEGAHRLRIEENIPEAAMEDLFDRAKILFMPSLSEGFGVPVLQSFAYGVCPVIADKGSLPEVGGDAAMYIDPLDEKEMISALERVISDEGLRRALVDRGGRRLAQYTAAQHLGRLAELYREILGHA